MPRRMYSGNAKSTTLNGGINSTQSNIVVTDATGYPSGASGNFWIVIDRGLTTEEKILCSNTTGNTITAVDRTNSANRDDTSNQTHSNGASVDHCYTADDADDANRHIFTTGDDDHTQYLNTTRFLAAHDVEARHQFGAGLGAPSAPAAVDQTTASAGSGDDAAREDHVHVQPDATPRGKLGFTAHTSDTAVTTSYADIVSVTVTTVASRRYKITAHLNGSITAADHAVTAKLMEGATVFSIDSINSSGFSTASGALHLEAIVTPSAASHTYKVQAVATLNGISVIADSTNGPGFIIVEDIGV